MRDEIIPGNIVRLAGLTYVVTETPLNLITYSRVPISEPYLGEAIERITCIAGASFMRSDRNCENLRSVFLAEMVARAIKGIVKLQLRAYTQKIKGVSPEFLATIYCEYFNVITGANPKANGILQEDVFEKIRLIYKNRVKIKYILRLFLILSQGKIRKMCHYFS